ncbi:MAG TPA: SRPBCC family protein [Herpetosiphonaceae bacterium]|nr:SRPBCC family protein [Herpetosiphonaceae bacterium]
MVRPSDRPALASSAGEIVSSRVFDSPCEVVFRAFTDPDVLARWWGPEGFSNTFHAFDPRPGGAWRLVMRGPDGTDYEITKEFIDIVVPERIVLRHVEPMHGFRMTMTFADESGKTGLTWRMVFDAVEDAERAREAIVEANEQNFDRLQAQLAMQA